MEHTKTPCEEFFDAMGVKIKLQTLLDEMENAQDYVKRCIVSYEKDQTTIKELLEVVKYFRSLVDADLLDSLTRNGNPYMDTIEKASKP
jgi:DNA-binding phage protein